MKYPKPPIPSLLVHTIGLLVLVIVLGVLSLTKGWLAFLFLPLLLVVTPILFVTQLWTNRVYHKKKDQKLLYNLVWWQLLALFVMFLLAPGAYDTPEMLLFGFIKVPDNPILIGITSIITIAAFIAFMCVTVWQCVVLIKNRRQHKQTA